MTTPDQRSPNDPTTPPGSTGGGTPGYREPQPRDGDDARHRGPKPAKDPEDGGLERDPDGGEASDDD